MSNKKELKAHKDIGYGVYGFYYAPISKTGLPEFTFYSFVRDVKEADKIAKSWIRGIEAGTTVAEYRKGRYEARVLKQVMSYNAEKKEKETESDITTIPIIK